MKSWIPITNMTVAELVEKTSLQHPQADLFIKNYADKPVVLRGEKIVTFREEL